MKIGLFLPDYLDGKKGRLDWLEDYLSRRLRGYGEVKRYDCLCEHGENFTSEEGVELAVFISHKTPVCQKIIKRAIENNKDTDFFILDVVSEINEAIGSHPNLRHLPDGYPPAQYSSTSADRELIRDIVGR